MVENGGAAIKLNLMNYGLVDKSMFKIEKLVDELLQIDKVRTALTYFDWYKDYKSWNDRELNNNIHNCYEYCYERFMPFFINLGFRKGIPVFDEKIEFVKDINSGIITMFLIEAGYFDKKMLALLKFVDKLYKTAEQECFDIFETDPQKIRWSKVPNNWKTGPFCKDIHVHDTDVSELPLPTIYHLKEMISMYEYIEDNTIKEKIDAVIKYIMRPEYQKLRGVYGVSWFYNKAYYAPSPGIVLPLYNNEKNVCSYKNTIEMMSLIPFVTNTEWFNNCMDLFEQYKTDYGTYMFPEDSFLSTFFKPANTATVYSAYISSDAKMKKNEKRAFVVELLSTFFILLMKSRMQRKN